MANHAHTTHSNMGGKCTPSGGNHVLLNVSQITYSADHLVIFFIPSYSLIRAVSPLQTIFSYRNCKGKL